ncbi:MAG: hypothetical protein Q7J82_01570 [Coriobacteriia bacterium]|nr:hypothetical protein [Coriobacteriia bacterium]
MSPTGGHYTVTQVEELVRGGRVSATLRVSQWLSNHGYDVKETISEVLTSLESQGRLTGSCTLMNGVEADEYVVKLAEDDWYLKFWIDEEQLVVNVWSCCWDGAAH